MEDINNNQNSHNFLAILKLLAETNKPLQGHTEKSLRKNATYLSPLIQNEITNRKKSVTGKPHKRNKLCLVLFNPS